MKCNHCGAEIPDDSKFCDQCGKKLDLGDKRPSNKMFIWLGVAALAIVVVVLIFTLSGNSSGDEDESGKRLDGIETAENTIKPGDSDAVKTAKIMDQVIRVLEREPNATNYRKFTELSMEIQRYTLDNEVYKALAKINPEYPNGMAYVRKYKPLSEKWRDWEEKHREEADRIWEEVQAHRGQDSLVVR